MIPTTDAIDTQEMTAMETWTESDRALLTQALQTMRDDKEHPKWTQPPLKLQRAEAAILQGRVTPSDTEGLYHIHGNSGHYTVDFVRCTCDGFLHGKTLWCTHRTAVEAYRRYQDLKAAQPQWPLFTGPPTIEERLAAAADDQITFTTGASTEPDEEPPMPLMTDEYIPEPEMPVETPREPMRASEDALKQYRQTIMRQLAVLGLKPRDKAEAEDRIMTHVGLVLAPENFPLIIERLSEIITTRTRATPPPIPDRYLKEIHGKKHVLFVGLLALAHERGLEELSAEFISVTPDLALAKGHAFFADGRKFYEAADATPGNVSSEAIKKHFARIALTRAKARCLRDALNIAEASVEEVE